MTEDVLRTRDNQAGILQTFDEGFRVLASIEPQGFGH